ncbi:glycopeptide antibiotics resistance protein [Salinibacterium sp. CAN_S4]|uniref:VanZ family protein n=1 Tax=Salinibacterium sp. CAN_S4 TaxID=2787727 RepID=UPI001A21B4F9
MTLAYLAVVAWLTLTPSSTGLESGMLDRLAAFLARFPETSWFTFLRLEFIANVAMFVPFGVFFVLLFGRRQWWLAIIVGMVMTLAIEGVQQIIPGRVPDVRDLVANSVGTTVGVLLALALTATRARRDSRKRVSA